MAINNLLLGQQHQITISSDQGRWCLENNEKVKILQESNLVKDSTIILLNIENSAFREEVKLYKLMHDNDSTIIVNVNKMFDSVVDTNQILQKENKKNKFNLTAMKIIAVIELIVIVIVAVQ